MNSARLPTPADLWKQGLCRDHPDPDIFYPDRDAATYTTVAAQAKAICRGDRPETACPILLECLFYGLSLEDPFGIWGGLSARERNALRRAGTLERYRAASHLRGTRYWTLIENYLEQADATNDNDEDGNEVEGEGDEPEAAGVPGGGEARIGASWGRVPLPPDQGGSA